MYFEQEYTNIILDTLHYGKKSEGRNGNTISTFGKSLTIDMKVQRDRPRFPLLLGRKMYYKGVLGELATFFKGPKNNRDFARQGCNYWKQWAEEDGSLNLDYGNAWINWNGVHQLDEVIKSLNVDPNSRRHLINAWRADKVINGELSLPCCHYAYQWYVDADGYLDMIWIQRSVDLMIGLPSDIILAAAWNIMMAEILEYKPGNIIMQLGDCHVYEEHALDALQYTTRVRSNLWPSTKYPFYKMENIKSYRGFTKDSIAIHQYHPMDPIKFLLKS